MTRQHEGTTEWTDFQASDRAPLRRALIRMGGIGILMPRARTGSRHGRHVLHLIFYLLSERSTEEPTPIHFAVGRDKIVTWHDAPLSMMRMDIWKALHRGPRKGTLVRRVVRLVEPILDQNFYVLERVNRQIQQLEEAVLGEPDKGLERETFRLKRTVLGLRRVLASERDALHRLIRAKLAQGSEDHIALMGLYDQAVRLHETANVYREILNSVLDSYFSAMSARLNEIVKTLTLVTTVMLPASLVAALYGMNFQYLPGANHPWGFWVVLGVVVGIGLGLLAVFRARRWL